MDFIIIHHEKATTLALHMAFFVTTKWDRRRWGKIFKSEDTDGHVIKGFGRVGHKKII